MNGPAYDSLSASEDSVNLGSEEDSDFELPTQGWLEASDVVTAPDSQAGTFDGSFLEKDQELLVSAGILPSKSGDVYDNLNFAHLLPDPPSGDQISLDVCLICCIFEERTLHEAITLPIYGENYCCWC